MWQYPDMMPKLYTWGPVVRKLMDGAGKLYLNSKTFHNKALSLKALFRFDDTRFGSWS